MIKDPIDFVRSIADIKHQWLYRSETKADRNAIDQLWRQWREAVAMGA